MIYRSHIMNSSDIERITDLSVIYLLFWLLSSRSVTVFKKFLKNRKASVTNGRYILLVSA